MKLEDRQIIHFYHLFDLVMFVGTIPVIIIFKTQVKWFYLLSLWAAIFLGIGLYRYFFFKKLTQNFKKVFQKAEGILQKGSYLFFRPPNIRFTYKNKDCCVRSVVDNKFRLLIEYSCQFEREAEFRIIRTKLKRGQAGQGGAAYEYRVAGEDKELYDLINANREARTAFDDIMQRFTYLFYGKDGAMHLEEIFDSCLTQEQTILSTFDKIIILGQFLKLD